MPLIYHYTQMSTFLQILRNQELWATDVRCCNDASETLYGRDEVVERLNAYADRVAVERPDKPAGTSGDPYIDKPLRDDPQYWANRVRRGANMIKSQMSDGELRVFAVCFTDEGDTLSQWRAYGQNGLAIGFEADPNVIMRNVHHVRETPVEDYPLDVDLIKLKYGPAGIEEVAQTLGNELNIQTTTSGSVEDNEGPLFWSGLRALAHTYSLKHEGFEEERETRLVISRPLDVRDTEVWAGLQHRVSATGLLTPYVKVPIDLRAIKEIYVGPGPHMDDNVRGMEDLKRAAVFGAYGDEALGFEPCIKPSKTPYR